MRKQGGRNSWFASPLLRLLVSAGRFLPGTSDVLVQLFPGGLVGGCSSQPPSPWAPVVVSPSSHPVLRLEQQQWVPAVQPQRRGSSCGRCVSRSSFTCKPLCSSKHFHLNSLIYRLFPNMWNIWGTSIFSFKMLFSVFSVFFQNIILIYQFSLGL